MPESINGWPVLQPDSSMLASKRVPGTERFLRMRASVLPLFLALAAEYHQRIRPIDEGMLDDWGYAYRQARMSESWSDHSSGTAIDLNAAREGAQGTSEFDWWKGEKSKIARDLLDKYEILMWGGSTQLGGSYEQPQNWDWMHWALKPGTDMADVKRVLDKLGIDDDGNVKKPEIVAPVLRQRILEDGQAPNVSLVAKALVAVGIDGFGMGDLWGDDKRAAYKKWERRIGVTPDGVPEYASLKPLGDRTGLFNTVK